VRLLITTLLAAELAIVGSFTAHTHWTFRDRQVAYKPLWLRFLQFNAKALVSTVLIMTTVVNVLVLRFNLHHYVAVPLGVLAGFTWNWLWDAQFIFRQAKSRQEAD
jgi:putative flippase GtrA